MKEKGTFLDAEWRKLLMVNYVVDPEILKLHIPNGTELDLWQGRCYVSLVGFMFLNTRLLGLRMPFHSDFEEINLRFYVKYREGGEYKRGVVFVKEIVPKPALSLVANTVYGENYETMRMRHEWRHEGEEMHVSYHWKKKKWHSMKASVSASPQPIGEGSEEEFITEHYWGYTKLRNGTTSEYKVEHPKWEVYPITQHEVSVHFRDIYGNDFSILDTLAPASVFLAEGSAIKVRKGRRI